MAELDTLYVTNPTTDDFTVNFNGEPYMIGAGEKKAFPEFLGFHVAKHLSDKIIREKILKIRKKTTENPYRPEVAQLQVYDNPTRRIALYDILQDKTLVERCVNAFPMKEFIGEIAEYDEYVSKKEVKEEKAEVTPTKAK